MNRRAPEHIFHGETNLQSKNAPLEFKTRGSRLVSSFFFFASSLRGIDSAMTVAAHKEKSNYIEMQGEKSLKCTSNYDVTVSEIEALLGEKVCSPWTTEDLDVDMTTFANSSAMPLPGAEDPDATEYSSSFGNTTSESENVSDMSDVEVQSEFCSHNGLASMLNDYGNIFPTRKKKLTRHWRKFIQPLMWRCKWTELRIKELEKQAARYFRKFASNDRREVLEIKQYTSEICSKSFPFIGHWVKRKTMKRRKRKQLEKVTDVTSYMANHHLFSYPENKQSDPGGSLAVVDIDKVPLSRKDEFGIDYGWFEEGENSLEHLLWKIEGTQSRVRWLTSRLDKVMLNSSVKFLWENSSLLIPYGDQTSSAHSPAFSTGDGNTLSIGTIYTPQHSSDLDIDDLMMPEIVASSYGEATPIPNIIESTVGLPSAADITMHEPCVVQSGESISLLS
ncbi:hypothetical protein Nepgr_010532 [Nepenthes gracilis]|uniref:Uncharacterized protein n=1 Tax=Nepenthes gracilis TaxID=150966 RepID=A0AAD3SCV6_NEPGR|nr:hypothetical protein Nepgr_010532 [Nepenthes gracilis]